MSKRSLFCLFLIVFSSGCFAQLIVGKIRFSGNSRVSDAQLQKIIFVQSGSNFEQAVINQDVLRIAEYYQKLGFWNTKVLAPKLITHSPTEIEVVFTIEEEENLIVTKIEISGNRYISADRLKLENAREPIELPELDSVLQNILNYYADNGFLFAAVELDSLRLDQSSLTAHLSVKEGDYCQFSEFRFRGNQVTKESIILRISQLKNRMEFSPAVLERAAENLRRKAYIKDCRILPLNSRQLLIEIEEDRMSLISGIVGFDNSQKKSRRFTGFLNAEFMNLYGTDRSLSLAWQHTASAQSSVALGYHESGPTRFPIAADAFLKREEFDSTYIKTEFQTEFYWYDLNSKYGLYGKLENIFPGSRRPQIVENNAFQKLGVFWNFSGVNHYQNPTQGSEYAVRYYTIFNRIDKSRLTKQAVELKYHKFLKMKHRFVLAALMNLNLIENKRLTQFETFELGGNKNLRGFAEAQFSGYQVAWTNLELRYLLNRHSRIYLFIDHGFVNSLNYKFGKLFGCGVGLKMETRLGLLGIDYAFSYQENELRNPLDGIIHFSVQSKL